MVGLVLLMAIAKDAVALDRQEAVCGAIKEPFFFWQWSLAAPTADASRIEGLAHVEAIGFMTSDHKRLAGYRYLANNGTDEIPPKGYLLMALGSAMVADQMITQLAGFASAGYDVYVYDYRGYAGSEGKRRIHAILADYRELIAALNDAYPRGLLYGIALGGAVLLDVIGDGVEYDRAVIDSSPSRLSQLGCPERIDPINNLPPDASKLLVITGRQDTVLGTEQTAELRAAAARHGASVYDGVGYGHPFMDRSRRVREERMARIRDFLLSAESPR